MRIYKLLPSKLFDWISSQIIYSSVEITPEKFVNKSLRNSLLLAIIAGLSYYFLYKMDQMEALATGVAAFFLIFGIILFLIMNSADSRGKQVEKILPDALELIASNIKSGLTTERALLVSALPEFGALSQELINASKELLAGEKIENALVGISKRIKSNVVDRTMWLLIQGIKNGGQISNLLVQMSTDLREENALKAESGANISMYVILILFSAAFGAPALFGISSFIVGVLSEQGANVGINPEDIAEYAAQSPALGLVGIPSATITEDFIVFFSIMALIVTSIFASLVLGTISTGKEKDGVKYMPGLIVVSLILFFVVRFLIKSAFGGFS